MELDTTILEASKRQFASWDVIELAYKMDMYTNSFNRQMPQLTDRHVIKSKIKKMKVKYAAQIFSARLSAYLEYNSKIRGNLINFIIAIKCTNLYIINNGNNKKINKLYNLIAYNLCIS